ncbi:MAG: hypothetical protein IJM27_04225 [Eubacterium sp.]|nr:hypothetical protein [Eubacterium sp.]
MEYKTEQERFWAGKFGDCYVDRNKEESLIASKTAFFSKALQKAGPIRTILELGSNIGLNEMALNVLFPGIKMDTVEINQSAADECRKVPNVTVYQDSILTFETERQYDLTFTCGVLIHLNPDSISDVYEKLYRFSKSYILVNEYYNPTPIEINYRGETGKLFKRDFAGEMMDQFHDLILIDYGFVYHRDPSFPLDDTTWFLMKKTQ